MSNKYKVTNFTEKRLPTPACNLGKRAVSLAQGGDGIHTLQLVIIKNEWRLSVNGKPLEYLGAIDDNLT